LQESRLWPVEGCTWKDATGDGHGEKSRPGDLANFQSSPPPSITVTHASVEEIKPKQPEACIDE